MQRKVYPDGLKLCPGCDVAKPLLDYYITRRAGTERSAHRCKACQSTYASEYSRTHRSTLNAARNARRKAFPEADRAARAKERAAGPFVQVRNGNVAKARKYGVPSEYIDYAAVLVRDNWTCQLCSETVEREELSFDHVIPMRRGGGNLTENIQVAHKVCNSRKAGFLPGEPRSSMRIECPNCGHRFPYRRLK